MRWFFRAGGAAGTISKSISAYDMKVSDAIYGPCARYVCRERLQSMLDYEQRLNIERLMEGRGTTTAFFSFADTVSARSFRGNNECHGWLGIKFQPRPLAESSQIIVHVRMLDVENALQQEALGIVGLNLIYGSQYYSQDPDGLVESLLDGLTTDRIEIDLIEFSGPEFSEVDNRVMSLRLVQLHLTGAAMFSCDGKVLQPSEVLHKKPVLVERGRFRPVTYVNLDLARSALRAFEAEGDDVRPGETISHHGDHHEQSHQRRHGGSAGLHQSRGGSGRNRPYRDDLGFRRVLSAGRLPVPLHLAAHRPRDGRDEPRGHIRRDVTTRAWTAASWRVSGGCSATTCGCTSIPTWTRRPASW